MSTALLLVPLVAAFVVLSCAGALTGALLARFAPSLPETRAPSTTARALVTFAPWIIAAIGCVALASPDPFAGCHCAEHGLHHPHLCLSHPAFAKPLFGPALLVLGAWLLLAAPRLFQLARELITSTLWARTIRRLPIEHEGGVSFRLHDCGAPSAFTVGVLSPFIVFDRRLWNLLSPEERRAVLHHEQGHAERRDGLTLLALRLCAALSPVPFGKGLLDAWRRAAEKTCDLHAAAALDDATTIAAALVSVERIRAQHPPTNPAHAVPALGVGAGTELESRVVALLDARPNSKDQRLGNDVLAAALVTLGAAALTVVWPGDMFHHAVETLIGRFVH